MGKEHKITKTEDGAFLYRGFRIRKIRTKENYAGVKWVAYHQIANLSKWTRKDLIAAIDALMGE